MNNPITSSISAHLEFLWFSVDDISKEWEHDVLLCKNDSRSNIIAFINKSDVIILQSTYSWLNEWFLNLLERLNDIHKRVNFTRWYLPDDFEDQKTVKIETTIKWYNRKDFWETLENFEKEIVAWLRSLDL